MPMISSPDQLLFLAWIATAIAYLVGSEIVETWQRRRAIVVRARLAPRPRRLPPPGPRQRGLD